MQITKNQDGEKLTVKVEGRLDTSTAPSLEAELAGLDGVNEMVFDFSNLEYVSSAGLRVILATQKAMSKKGGLVLTGVSDAVMEVFEITGFADILTIQ